MSEMVERVAAALCASDGNGFLDDCTPGRKNAYLIRARDAIESMREPTNEMHKAMCECYNSPACIWMTGIDAALS